MSDNNPKYENQDHVIFSEVPGEQLKREGSEFENSDTFIPVMTVTKNETVLTKGDVKLQKVTVTETVSNATMTVTNPLYSEVFGDVISGPQPMRKLEKRPSSKRNYKTVKDTNSEINSNKSATRIPKLRFRNTVAKVKDARQRSTEVARREKEVLQSQKPRRSSIPKFKKSDINPMTQKKVAQPEAQIDKKKTNEEKHKPEEEFDKLFDEIIHDNSAIADETLSLETSIDDEKLLNSFEEIIHAYEEHDLEPVAVENKKNIQPKRTILTRHQSYEPPKVPRSDRRNSLITNIFIEKDKVKVPSIDLNTKPSKQQIRDTFTNKNNPSAMQLIENQSFENLTETSIDNGNTTSIKSIPEISNIDSNKTPCYDEKQALDETVTPSLVDNKEFMAIENKIKLFELNRESVPTSPMNDIRSRKSSIEDDTPSLKGKVSRIISKIDSKSDSDEKIESIENPTINEIPKKRSVLSRIALFERKESSQSVKSHIELSEIRSPIKSRDVIKALFQNNKPVIVEEVLKAPIRRASDDNENTYIQSEIKQSTTLYNESDTSEKHNNEHVILQNNSAKYEKAVIDIECTSTIEDCDKVNIKYDVNDVDHIEATNEEEFKGIENVVSEAKIESNCIDKVQKEFKNIEIRPNGDRDKTEKIKTQYKNSEERIVEIRLQRFESKQSNVGNDTILNRSKSVIDTELGNSVKGKVQHILESINSERTASNVKKEINIMERPRKKSVSEKIALFERKMTSAALDEPKTSTDSLKRNDRFSKNKDDVIIDNNIDNKYAEKITELKNAKQNYGVIFDMPSVELNNGVKMPALALGTGLMEQQLVKHIVCAAIDLGYRAVDTAYIHGNEQSVGEAIREKIKDGTVNRDDLFITSKLWNTFHRPQLVEKACQDSLTAMGLDYFDLYLIQNPMSFKEETFKRFLAAFQEPGCVGFTELLSGTPCNRLCIVDEQLYTTHLVRTKTILSSDISNISRGDSFPTIANVVQYSEHEYIDAWFAMQQLVKKGLVKSIGLSNFNSVQIAKIIDKRTIKPVVDQVECHPYLNQERLREYCEAHGILLSCYGVLGSNGTPAVSNHPAVEAVMDDPLIKDMASALNISTARLLVSYQLERGLPVVVKASSGVHLWDNLQAVACKLSQTHIDSLNSLNRNKRYFSFKGMGDTHKHYPFKIPF